MELIIQLNYINSSFNSTSITSKYLLLIGCWIIASSNCLKIVLKYSRSSSLEIGLYASQHQLLQNQPEMQPQQLSWNWPEKQLPQQSQNQPVWWPAATVWKLACIAVSSNSLKLHLKCNSSSCHIIGQYDYQQQLFQNGRYHGLQYLSQNWPKMQLPYLSWN